MLDLADLHDAILESVAIQVATGAVTFVLTPVQFEGAAKRVILHARQWKMLVCPKEEPWGHAAEWQVNKARGPSMLESGMQHLELEMRTGDVIQVDAASIERVDDP